MLVETPLSPRGFSIQQPYPKTQKAHEGLFVFLVVAVDPGSIPCKCKPTNSRYDPAEGCGKVLARAAASPPAAIFRILPNRSFGSIQCRISPRSSADYARAHLAQAVDVAHNRFAC